MSDNCPECGSCECCGKQMMERISMLEKEKSCGELDLSLMDGMRQRIATLEKVAELAEEERKGNFHSWHEMDDALEAAGYLQ